jgi:hypothetical protein
MSEVTSIDKKENHSSGWSDATFDSFPQNIKSIIASVRVVVDQIDLHFKQARELIVEIAKELDERELCERDQISRTIKKILRDEIQAGKITEKWIEECLAPEYKRQYNKSVVKSKPKTCTFCSIRCHMLWYDRYDVAFIRRYNGKGRRLTKCMIVFTNG